MVDAWHAPRVRAFNKMLLAEGARVQLLAGRGQRGPNARKLHEVEETEPTATGAGDSGSARPTAYLGADVDVGPLVPARVRWFDKQKGFGFVNIFGRTEDVFVHMETVRRCGFQDLAGGEGMAVRTFRRPRGLMVAELKLWESAPTEDDRD